MSLDSQTVQVSNISPSATEKTIADFFSFCGKISNLYLNKENNSAVVQFESESAAKTALLLTNALIIDRPIQVSLLASSEPSSTPSSSSTFGTQVDPDQIPERNFGVPDEQRSKTSVVASLLSAGYVLADGALDKAKEFDEKFNIANTAKAVADQIKTKAQEIDQQFLISEKASAVKAIATEKVNQVDEKFQVSQKAQQAMDAVKKSAQDVANKVQENPAAQSAYAQVQAVGNSLANYITETKEQTSKAIDEKQRERGKVVDQPSTPSEPQAPQQ
eukprot:TRINITY_DN188_c0_g1_i1.p1 TRINITY_DN188_c0_g1~~TRINITY_DN188_c0_g1_i1.p1  ORF type:complete len:275 (-),score=118.50 TRINITY_DN188_c0_g1_i1:76-900(-)